MDNEIKNHIALPELTWMIWEYAQLHLARDVLDRHHWVSLWPLRVRAQTVSNFELLHPTARQGWESPLTQTWILLCWRKDKSYVITKTEHCKSTGTRGSDMQS